MLPGLPSSSENTHSQPPVVCVLCCAGRRIVQEVVQPLYSCFIISGLRRSPRQKYKEEKNRFTRPTLGVTCARHMMMMAQRVLCAYARAYGNQRSTSLGSGRKKSLGLAPYLYSAVLLLCLYDYPFAPAPAAAAGKECTTMRT